MMVKDYIAAFSTLFLVAFATNSYGACASFKSGGASFDVVAQSGIVSVEKNGTSILKKESIEPEEKSAFISDFNFDGLPDFAILRDSGVERYFDVYVFNRTTNSYEQNKEISALACPEVNAKKKLLISTCNRVSACEGWRSYFKFTPTGLILVRKEGTSCDPASGQGFRYSETYRLGKIINKSTTRIKE
jgi:hypothetical protein